MLKFITLLALISYEITGFHINSVVYQEHFDACGVMSSAAGLIQGGNYSTQTQFPWIGIIAVKNDDVWDQYGSGSLITRRHFLSKSRYVSALDDFDRYVSRDPKNIKIYLGTTNYNDLTQEGSKAVDVASIKLYPNSRRIVTGFSLFNFAILTFQDEVTFTDFIKPICLWSNDLNNDMFSGQKMTAVGYGRDLTGEISKTRKHVAVQVTSTDECLEEYSSQLSLIKESRFFCVKEIVKDHGPCRYDTQLYLKVGSSWYLRGEMITSRVQPDTLICEPAYPIAVEDITPYVDWINEETKEDLVEIHYLKNGENGFTKVIDTETIQDNRLDD